MGLERIGPSSRYTVYSFDSGPVHRGWSEVLSVPVTLGLTGARGTTLDLPVTPTPTWGKTSSLHHRRGHGVPPTSGRGVGCQMNLSGCHWVKEGLYPT